jgi:hypothetical protein
MREKTDLDENFIRRNYPLKTHPKSRYIIRYLSIKAFVCEDSGKLCNENIKLKSLAVANFLFLTIIKC